MATSPNLSCAAGQAITYTVSPPQPANVTNQTFAWNLYDASGNILVQLTNGNGITITDPINGVFSITLTAANTLQTPGKYNWDFWRIDAGFQDQLASGSFTIEPSSRTGTPSTPPALVTYPPNTVLAGPTSGPGNAIPTARALTTSDLPSTVNNSQTAGQEAANATVAGGLITGLTWIASYHNSADPKYALKGDGSNDYTGLQSWINDGIASGRTLVLRPPPGGVNYSFGTGLVFGSGISAIPLRLIAEPAGGYPLNYTGANGTSALTFNGANFPELSGVNVNLGGAGEANQAAFDFIVTSTNLEQSQPDLRCCRVRLQGSGGNHVAFRLGQYTNGDSDISGLRMANCSVTGEGANNGSIGLQLGGAQAKPTLVSACNFSNLGCAILTAPIGTLLSGSGVLTGATSIGVVNSLLFPSSGTVVLGSSNTVTYTGKNNSTNQLTGIPSSGAGSVTQNWGGGTSCNLSINGQGVYQGAGDVTFSGVSGGGNHWDYLIGANGRVTIQGGRWEGNTSGSGNHFLQTGYGDSSVNYNVLLEGVTLSGYVEPTDYNGVFVLNANTTLLVMGCDFRPGSGQFDANFITNPNSNTHGSVTILDTQIQAANPFWTLSNNWPVNLRGVQLSNSSGSITTLLSQIESSLFGLGIAPVGVQSITGALSQVTDSNAKTVLTSLLNALVAFGLGSNGTS